MIMDVKVKLIAIDVDGTLVNSKKELSIENIEAIKYAVDKGIKVMIASGRPLSGIKQYEMPFEEDIPFITFNGAMVVRKDSNKILYNKTIDFEEAYNILKYIYDNNINVVVWSNSKLYVNVISETTKNYGFKSGCAPVLSFDINQMCDDGVNKILLYGENKDLLRYKDDIVKISNKVNLEFSSPYYLEIFNIEASKGNAVKALCEYYGFSKDEALTIGDNFNDLSMLKYSGISVAMGNSPDEIKKMCTFVTKTNEESGVAHAIYSLIK